MLPQNVFPPAVPLLIFALALLIDFTIREPPDKLHPTVWMGKVIALLKPKTKSKNPRIEKLNGILLGLFTVTLFALPVYFILPLIQRYFGLVTYIVVAAILLKPTFAFTCMEHYTLPIAKAIKRGNIDEARQLLPYIVRRDPKKLSEQQIISATVESIGEGTVDGITSPLFYFALFGVPGAITFRAINTLDSMVGYKDPEHANIGWFSARLDALANYIPARLTAFLMIVAAWLLHENWKDAWRILHRDKGKTDSLNAGWTMSTIAGALSVRLEKPGFYTLGDASNALSPKHVPQALRIMKLTTYLFEVLIVIPLLISVVMILG